MARDAACLGIGRIVVAHHQSVDGEGVLLGGDFLGEGIDAAVDGIGVRVVNILALDGGEPLLVEPLHALAPGVDGLVGMHQCERYPAYVSVHDVLRVLDAERARRQVARVGIVLAALHEVALEIVVRDDCLAANDHMARVADGCWNAADGLVQMGDVGADVPVATGDNLRQFPVVVGDDQRQSVEFPGYPDGAPFSPLHQFFGQLGLGQRESSVLVLFLLALGGVFAHLLGGRVGEGGARLGL